MNIYDEASMAQWKLHRRCHAWISDPDVVAAGAAEEMRKLSEIAAQMAVSFLELAMADCQRRIAEENQREA